MGTRHLIAAIAGGTYRIAQYGQFDGYPEGQGLAVAAFVRKLTDPAVLASFKTNMDRCRFGTKEEFDEIYAKYSDGSGWMTTKQSEAFKESRFGYLSRDTSADILNTVANWNDPEAGILLSDQYAFAADGLFCEWAYVIDVDNEKLEVYSGFHKAPAPEGERFAAFNATASKEYGPVHLLKEFSFTEVAQMTDDEFVKSILEKDKEIKGYDDEDEE